MQFNKPGYQELWDSDSGDESDVHCARLRGTDCDQLFFRLKSACTHTDNVSSGPTEAYSCQQGGQAQSATCDRSRSVTELSRVPGIGEAFILRSCDLQGLPCLLVNSHRHFGRVHCLHIRCPDIRGPDVTVSCPR
jgi:hypothetical protein